MSKENKLQTLLRSLPAMERILSDSRLAGYENLVERDVLKRICRATLDRWRDAMIEGETMAYADNLFFAEIKDELERRRRPSLRGVMNATGVVIHTNLGRSCLAPEAVEAVNACATGYSTLEYTLESGSRGHRNAHVEWLLCQLTGAEAAVVVNNNASAVLLVLAALSSGREAIVSRGELVEIGGSFRIPDIMSFAGTKLVEVGCTNRTHLVDYERAMTDETALLLKVHPSNFRITGFHSVVPREDLADLAHRHQTLMVEDLGSGILIGASELGIEGEPTVAECVRAGADVVTFSGDKLLGGPQIGGIVGRKNVIEKLRRYPLLRALRCDKMTLAAMEATLRLYLKGEWQKVPTLAMVSVPKGRLYERAVAFKDRIDCELKDLCLLTALTESEDAVGGGSYPERPLSGWAVSLRVTDGRFSSGALQERLRLCDDPLIAGAQANALCLHMRTITPDEEGRIIASLRDVLAEN